MARFVNLKKEMFFLKLNMCLSVSKVVPCFALGTESYNLTHRCGRRDACSGKFYGELGSRTRECTSI